MSRAIQDKGLVNKQVFYIQCSSVCCCIWKIMTRSQIINMDLGQIDVKSCVTQLLETIQYWTESLDKPSCVDAMYLEYSKPFDSVPHDRLLAKLGSY